MTVLNRRDVLKGALGVLGVWTSAGVLGAQQASSRPGQGSNGQGGVRRLTDQMTVVDGGGSNVLAFFTGDGFVLVDSGAPKSFDGIMASLPFDVAQGKPFDSAQGKPFDSAQGKPFDSAQGKPFDSAQGKPFDSAQGKPFDVAQGKGAAARVTTLFNTHHHLDQTGNNELLSKGTKIIAHKRTLEWMSADHWIHAEERFEKARPKAARPAETFLTTGSMTTGGEQIDYGHLTLAHTNGDIYVYFRKANVLAVGDVASPLRDPALDYLTGAWIGGRVDSMDVLLKLANDQTRIVPAYGPVMSKAEFKAERDVMEEVRKRLFDQVREGDGPKDMLERGVLKGLARTWNDPYKFLYDAAKGLWAHHDKLAPNVV